MARDWHRYVVVDHVAFIVEVDRLEGFSRRVLVDVEQIAVLTLEAGRPFASGAAGMPSQYI
jgi:hypothetical protein